MANSRIISELKTKVTKMIINDEELVKAIDPPNYQDENWEEIYMINSAETEEAGYTPVIYREHQNPNMITKTMTFLTIEVNIPENYNTPEIFKYPQLEIWIISHNKHNRIDNIKGVRDNRNDYISILLDEKFNGESAGIGSLKLISNTAGIYDDKFVYRRLTFTGIDLSDTICD